MNTRVEDFCAARRSKPDAVTLLLHVRDSSLAGLAATIWTLEPAQGASDHGGERSGLRPGFSSPYARVSERWILLVDDNQADQEITLLALREAGWSERVELAMDGEQALERLRRERQPPLLILLDLRMPRMNGLETLDRIRRLSVFDCTKVVVFTSSPLEDDKKRAAELGCDLYLEKPLDFNGSLDVARRLLRLSDVE